MADRDLPKAVLACMELLSRRKHGLIPDEDWNLLCRLQTHIDDFKANGSYANIELMAMGASQFSMTQTMFDKDFVAAMYARVSKLADFDVPSLIVSRSSPTPSPSSHLHLIL